MPQDKLHESLLAGIRCGDLKAVKEALAAGADPNAKISVRFDYQHTPHVVTILTCSLLSHFYREYPYPLEIAEELLKGGADPNLSSVNGDYKTELPLHSLFYLNNNGVTLTPGSYDTFDMVGKACDLLFRYGADPLVTHSDGRTILHHLVIPINSNALYWLSKSEAFKAPVKEMMTMRTKSNNTPLGEFASGTGLWTSPEFVVEVCKMLNDMGADFSANGSASTKDESFERVMEKRGFSYIWRDVLPYVTEQASDQISKKTSIRRL